MRHFDFTRIHDEFVNYYKTLEKGESEYYSWLRALSLDESKPYGFARESFKWAKSMLNYLREDAENKYYGVLVGLPIRSMNQNVYRERDLIAASLTLKGKHPSLNHKDSFWFNEQSRWGTLTIADAKYEDGAIEAVLKVPKTAVCPICNGAKMTELIDKQHIVNVSLEGSMEGAFEFTDPPFTLLTSDVLPGIPLARIKPLETIMVEALQVSTGKKKMIKPRIIEENITQPKVNVDTDSNNPNFKGIIGTPVNADAKIDSQNDLAKTVLGTPAVPDNYTMQSGSPMTDVMPGSTEAKVCEPCSPELRACVDKLIADGKPEDSAWAICKSQLGEAQESTPPEYATVPSRPNSATSMPKPEDIRTGPTKSKAPVHSDILLPEGAPSSLPSHIKPSVVMGESPGKIGVAVGTPAVETLNKEALDEKVQRFKAEDKARSLEEQVTTWQKRFTETSESLIQMTGRHEEQKLQTQQANERMENAFRDMNNAIVERDRYKRLRDESAGERDEARLNYEKLKTNFDVLNEKYQKSMQTNLELSNKLTSANEDYLEIHRKLESNEEALKRAQIEAKKIIRIQA